MTVMGLSLRVRAACQPGTVDQGSVTETQGHHACDEDDGRAEGDACACKGLRSALPAVRRCSDGPWGGLAPGCCCGGLAVLCLALQ